MRLGELFSPKSYDLSGAHGDVGFFVPKGLDAGPAADAEALKLPAVAALDQCGNYCNLTLKDDALFRAALDFCLRHPPRPFDAATLELDSLFGENYPLAVLHEVIKTDVPSELPRSATGRKAVVWCLCAPCILPARSLMRAAKRALCDALCAVEQSRAFLGTPPSAETPGGACCAAMCALGLSALAQSAANAKKHP